MKKLAWVILLAIFQSGQLFANDITREDQSAGNLYSALSKLADPVCDDNGVCTIDLLETMCVSMNMGVNLTNCSTTIYHPENKTVQVREIMGDHAESLLAALADFTDKKECFDNSISPIAGCSVGTGNLHCERTTKYIVFHDYKCTVNVKNDQGNNG